MINAHYAILHEVDSLIQVFIISDDLARSRQHFQAILQALARAWEGLESLQRMNHLEHDLWNLHRTAETRADRLEYDIRTRELELRPVLMQLG